MPSPLDATGPTPRDTRRASVALRGLRSMGLGVVIGLLLAGAGGTPLWPSLVRSVSIATLCWFVIDLGRIPLARWKHRHADAGTPEARSDWPGWPLMSIAIVLGTIVGFGGGNALASWVLGQATPGFFRGGWGQALALLIGALVPGSAITYWYYSRETIAAKEAAVQTAQRQVAEHRLKLLESQLEPHMLFNTLANLRVLIGTDATRAQAMLDQLIAFLRATLDGSRAAQHPLRAEFARLADYLALMQVRMGDRLQTRFELPDALADTPVPALLLQPLVENGIKHGLEPAVAGGRIAVSAVRDGAELVLRVRDTGAGLSGLGTDSASASASFGLVQVRERLAALYGTRASLTLRNADDAEGGTLATIRLPMPMP